MTQKKKILHLFICLQIPIGVGTIMSIDTSEAEKSAGDSKVLFF
jgi:hypothetical protein